MLPLVVAVLVVHTVLLHVCAIRLLHALGPLLLRRRRRWLLRARPLTPALLLLRLLLCCWLHGRCLTPLLLLATLLCLPVLLPLLLLLLRG